MARGVIEALTPEELAQLIVKYGDRPDPARPRARFPMCNLMCAVSAPGHDRDSQARLLDASLGGIGIETALDLVAGEEIVVRMEGLAPLGSEIHARVMWSRPSSDGTHRRIGAAYIEA